MKTILRSLLDLILLRRPDLDLDSRWWHRLVKVWLWGSTILLVAFPLSSHDEYHLDLFWYYMTVVILYRLALYVAFGAPKLSSHVR